MRRVRASQLNRMCGSNVASPQLLYVKGVYPICTAACCSGAMFGMQGACAGDQGKLLPPIAYLQARLPAPSEYITYPSVLLLW